MAATNFDDLRGILFISRIHAENYLAKNKGRYPSDCEVRGLTQDNLFAYILTIDAMGGGYLISNSGEHYTLEEVSRRELISHFYVGKRSLPDVPQVMPSVAKRMASGQWRHRF